MGWAQHANAHHGGGAALAVPLCPMETDMAFLRTMGRLLDAIATGFGVVLGLIPDPRFPTEQDLQHR